MSWMFSSKGASACKACSCGKASGHSEGFAVGAARAAGVSKSDERPGHSFYQDCVLVRDWTFREHVVGKKIVVAAVRGSGFMASH